MNYSASLLALVSVVTALVSPAVQAQSTPLPMTAAAKAGFSKTGLARIDRFFEREIAQNRVPGAVVAVARDGKLVYYKSFGYLDKDQGRPMPLDAIFGLASMTKIMTAVGALSLTQEGRLPLQSRLSQYFPDFASMKVAVRNADGSEGYEAQKRPIFVHDLFRHTAGLTYGGRPDSGSPASKLYPPGSSLPKMASADEFIQKVTQLPLVYQPGTIFEYSIAMDVLGATIEKISGKTLGGHLSEVVWEPLGMKDTGFHIPADKRDRVAQPLKLNPLTGKPQRIQTTAEEVHFECGGGCSVGTIGDYVRFGQMLMNGGSLDGHQILSPAMVRLMTSNHLGKEIVNRVANVEPHRDGYGFGLGVAVRMEPG
ncbi:MAG: beta-lactamase family protein, partial [Burkholderiales bacterium]|nr:beta-lactamase family protein [Burkholderiales bacterium]